MAVPFRAVQRGGDFWFNLDLLTLRPKLRAPLSPQTVGVGHGPG